MTGLLRLDDPATVAELVDLQRAAYRVEAGLIGSETIPALSETPERLAAAGETFLGARGGGRLLGAVGYRCDDGIVDVRRLVVHPDAFRRGVVTGLLDALEAREPGATGWTVSTATGNRPARALYERRGFRPTGESETPDGVRLVHYSR